MPVFGLISLLAIREIHIIVDEGSVFSRFCGNVGKVLDGFEIDAPLGEA
jgi:hypothetical protein